MADDDLSTALGQVFDPSAGGPLGSAANSIGSSVQQNVAQLGTDANQVVNALGNTDQNATNQSQALQQTANSTVTTVAVLAAFVVLALFLSKR